MRTSSARQQQQELDFSGTSSSERRAVVSEDISGVPSGEKGQTAVPSFPNFGLPNELVAITARRAGRLNASTISPGELDAFLRERQLLLDKKFDETITRREEIRLTYVNWQLDRIEDAMHGQVLDELESWVSHYEQFRENVEVLQERLSQQKARPRK